jgi:type IV secretion system protein VirD4
MKDADGKITQPGDMIIYVAGFPAIYGTQPLYFQDETFAARAQVNPPNGSDKLTSL